MYYKDRLTYKIQGAIYEVYNVVGPGLLESAYQAALMHELKLRGLKAVGQEQVPVIYKGVEVKDAYVLDIMVEDKVIIELKSVEELRPVHFKQLMNYLRLRDKYVGFLVNFNTEELDADSLCKVFNKHATVKDPDL